MNDQCGAQSIQVSPYYYFKEALTFIRLRKESDAIAHIDCAIIFSSHSPFYIYQKIKLLFASNDFALCSHYILDQAHFLYKNASLYITCRVIDYYESINNLSSDDLKEVLTKAKVPYCLADEYLNVLNGTSSDLFYYAKKASMQDDFQLCIDYCSLIQRQNKSTWEVLYLAAYSYHMIGDLPRACDYYKQCIQMNPEYHKAYNDLGLALMELSAFTEALNYLNKARYLSPANVDYLSHIAECYYGLRQYALSEETLESIINISPASLQTYFNLSHICKRQNKNRLSKKYMKTAQKQLKK